MAQILIIDDTNEFREMLCTMLERAGYEVIQARDGKEGVDLFQKSPTDLVITDLLMPNQDGIETIRHLKKDFPDIKIIAVSGGGRGNKETYLKTAELLHVHRTLSKPFSREEILKAVEEVLGQ